MNAYGVLRANPLDGVDPTGLARNSTKCKHQEGDPDKGLKQKKRHQPGKKWYKSGKPMDRRNTNRHRAIWITLALSILTEVADNASGDCGCSTGEIDDTLQKLPGYGLLSDNVPGLGDLVALMGWVNINITDALYVQPMNELIEDWNSGMVDSSIGTRGVSPADVSVILNIKVTEERERHEEELMANCPSDLCNVKRVMVRGVDVKGGSRGATGIGGTPVEAMDNARLRAPAEVSYDRFDWVFIEFEDGTRINFPGGR